MSPPPGPPGKAPVVGPAWTRTDRPDSVTIVLRKLLGYIGNLRHNIYLGVFLALISAILALIAPQYLMDITNYIQKGIGGTMDIDSIGRLCITLLVIYSVSLFLSMGMQLLIQNASMRISFKIRGDLIRKINRIPLAYFDKTNTGDLLSRLTNDTDTIADSFGESIAMLLTSTTMMIGALIMMLYTNVTLALVSCIPVAVAFLGMAFVIRRTQKYFVMLSRGLGGVNGIVEETYYGMDIVRAYNGQAGAQKAFDSVNRGLLKSIFQTRFIAGLMPRMIGFFNNLGYVLVCVAGSYMIIRGVPGMSIGVVVAFIVYVRQFTQPFGQIADSFYSLQSVCASGERVLEILDVEEMSQKDNVQHISNCTGEVEFRDVSFSYVPGTEVIHRFSLKVKPGTKVAIVGPTGAGKTTLVNLLMRFYDVDSGSILVDDVDIGNVPREEVHDQFSMVLQDSWIFKGTVRDNIVYTSKNISDDKVWEALRAVGIDGYVEGIGGLDAVLKDTDSLSAGQRQQLSIARAIVRNAQMIILDEATSSVDTRTEQKIQNAMEALTSGRTSFIIAHRLTTIRSADTILVMRDGRIVEQGTHESLLEENGFYAELYRSQFRNCD